MDSRAGIVASCWFAVAIIAAVYMWVFAGKVGDVLFGVFLPVGALVLVAFIVTFGITFGSASKPEPEKAQAPTQSASSGSMRFCTQCGTQNDSNAIYCKKCGKQL